MWANIDAARLGMLAPSSRSHSSAAPGITFMSRRACKGMDETEDVVCESEDVAYDIKIQIVQNPGSGAAGWEMDRAAHANDLTRHSGQSIMQVAWPTCSSISAMTS